MRGEHRVILLAGAAAVILAAVPASAQAKRVSWSPMPAVSAADPDQVSLPREVVADAMRYRGVPYVHGGDDRDGLDCSGLVFRAFVDTLGMKLPRGVGGLFNSGGSIAYDASRRPEYPVLHVGDLVFFDTDSVNRPRTASHVGIYAGAGRFVHAASEGSHTGVIVSDLANPYYSERFLGARRVVPWRPPVLDIFLTDSTTELTTLNPFPSREKMTIRIFNRMSGGGPMDMVVLKDGARMTAERIAPGTYRPVLCTITPDAGTWTVRVSRLFKGRELQGVTFTVEE